VESVVIYETYNPGAAVAIYAFDYTKSKWIRLWSIFDERNFCSNRKARARCKMEKCARKFKPNLRRNDVFTNKLRVEFDHSILDYYYEIDAIELIGYNFDLNLSRLLGKALSSMTDELENEMQPLHETLSSLTISSESDLVDHELSKEEENNDELNLATLPNDVLFAILSYLDLRSIFQLRSTCKRMYELCSGEQLFVKLDLQPYWNSVNDDLLNLLSQLSSDMTMLSLSWSKLVTNQAFSRFVRNSCSSLQLLKLDNCQYLDTELLRVIVENCTQLEQLSLSSCENINDFSCLKRMKKLKNLNLYRTQIEQNQLVEIIVESENRLKHLNLGSCVCISDFDEIIEKLATYCNQIETLDLWRAYSLTPIGVEMLATSCVNLRELDIGWCRNITSFDCLKNLIRNCTKLRKLFMTSIRISDVELLFLCENLCHIEQLDILGSNLVLPDTVTQVLRKCSALKLFDISFCPAVNMSQYYQLCNLFSSCEIKKSFQTDLL